MSGRLEDTLVLIVDDDEDVLGSIQLAMQAEGAETITAADGNAGLHAYQAQDPDVVVLDMMLPRASGFVVLEKIVEDEDPPVVVMVTANQGQRHMAYAKDLGVHAYFTKPVSLERLIDTIVDLLDEHDADTPSEDA